MLYRTHKQGREHKPHAQLMEGILWHEQGKRRGHMYNGGRALYHTHVKGRKELYAARSIKGGSYTSPNET